MDPRSRGRFWSWVVWGCDGGIPSCRLYAPVYQPGRVKWESKNRYMYVHTQIQSQQITAHPIVQSGVMDQEFPFCSLGHLRCAPERLEGLFAELTIGYDQCWIVGEVEFGLEARDLRVEVGVGWWEEGLEGGL